MHLEFNERGQARPDLWAVIDDFGTKHDCILSGRFGSPSDKAAEQRRRYRFSEDHDPDVNRAFWCQPEFHSARESTAFASHIGLSIEAEIRIAFALRPAWDDRTNTPLFTQAEGATIEILHVGVAEWDWRPTSTAIAHRALQAFCWAYLDMEKARAAAKPDAQKGRAQ